ncbi:Lrp/AsnC family transcriptional regulator [Homoserinimonas sp. OAct 916]|uniref:Lrp/AsnC family transcriptional regulator n=1 Tax=Homoserinimonas sp. OAct 916 TaxID=2211450 RepID=UPI000DBE13BE|nr:Lrp/AsnC family transcriptional regulator [Homoserinimonas sp. OAct 916]
MAIDELDARLIDLLTTEPRLGVFELSRRLGVARGTAQARLDRLLKNGVIKDFAPTIDPAGLGYPVMAFITAEISQGERDLQVIEHLAGIPEVLEAHTITGPGDLLLRVVATSNSDLQRVIDQVVSDTRVTRTSTVIVLDSQIPARALPLVWAATSSE